MERIEEDAPLPLSPNPYYSFLSASLNATSEGASELGAPAAPLADLFLSLIVAI